MSIPIGMIAASLSIVMPSTAHAAGAVRMFDIPAGPLSRSILVLSKQSGVTIGIFGKSVENKQARRLRGRLTMEEALRRLLKGSGCSFRMLPGGAILIVPGRERPVALRRTVSRTNLIEHQPDIIVTGSKRDSPFSDYPAAVTIVNIDQRAGPATLTDGTNAIIDQVPAMASTYLGPGRDKIYIQGIADSSFAGNSAATVAEYLGDVRLTYNAPDPNLNLYDIKRVEVLEGPQATLYGAGSLGGILRLVPNDPDTGRFEGSMAAGLIDTVHGDRGGDVAGMINIPVVSDRVAIRAVGYHQSQPGYIDDNYRELKDINRVLISGGRVMARIEAGDGWTLDIGGVIQSIRGRDAQYAVTGLPPLTQRAFAAQPYDNHYRMGAMLIRKDWGRFDLKSVTSFVKQNTSDTYVGYGMLGNQTLSLYRETDDISMISNETRLSGKLDGINFVAGLSALYFRGFYTFINTGVPCVAVVECRTSRLKAETLVRNHITDLSAFGELDLRIAKTLSMTAGGRLEYTATTSDQSSELSRQGATTPFFQKADREISHQLHAVPSLALSWKPFQSMMAFARYQRSFRPGGFQLDLVETGGQVGLSDFPSDHVDSVQLGVRYGSSQQPLAATIILSHAKWSKIQADQPTVNTGATILPVGDAMIDSIEASVTARPIKALTVQASLFSNRIKRTIQEFGGGLPNIPGITAAANAAYGFFPFADGELIIRAAMRYTGKSQPETVGTEMWQSAYWTVNTGVRLSMGRYGISLDVTNIGDVRGNRFVFGNPFADTTLTQVTPLRPRSIRLGIDAIF